MDGPKQNVFPYYMVGPIQNVSQNMLNGWPHTECFAKHAKWMAPYRMIIQMYYMDGPYRMFFHTYYMDGPIQ